MATKPDTNYTLSGRITNQKGQSLEGLIVRAFYQDPTTADNPLGDAVTDANGKYIIRFTEKQFKSRGKKCGGLDVYIRVYEGEALLGESPVKCKDNRQIRIDLKIAYTIGDPAMKRRIEGRIVLENCLPAENIKLRLYSREFGDKAELLVETTTRKQGLYTLPYNVGGKVASLEIRAVDAAGKEIPLSKPLNYLGQDERQVVNLGALSTLQPLAAEYQRLAIDLKPHVGDMKKLASCQENTQRQDITVLNRATGWDARLIALAATAARLSTDTDVKLPQDAVYGLLRAGLPSDKLRLAQVDPDVVERALKTVRDAGIVELSDQKIVQFKKQFMTFAQKVRLNVTAPGSHSTYDQLLKASGLSINAQAKFAQVYFSHRGDSAQLWESARNAGLNDTQIGKLQLQGKLAFLAGNSEAMTAQLMQKQVNDPVQLVESDFYRAEPWIKEIFNTADIPAIRRNNLTDADKKKLDAIIPVAYAAENVEDRLNAYAEDMARKVRLSYPTQVVGRMIEQDSADAFKLGEDRANTATLLKSAASQGFRLGQTPVTAFLKTHVGVATGMTDNEFQAAQQQMKMLHRIYQITPSNEAMPVLLSLGMTSAYDMMAYSEAVFAELYAAAYFDLYGSTPTEAETELIYRKAQQVSSVTYNIFATAKKLDSEIPVEVVSAPIEVRENVRNELIKQFPTMETLFGSMDFCECEHCRSVLSPAAYLVDLLQFIDVEEEVWGNFLAHWKATHNNQEYTAKYKKPYDALVERRPDLPHILLTCENTHTALPYIDIVNEILEYYVANGKLEEDAAHDTGDATTAELLAEPQNVIREAYDKLREERYPLNLPFDLWIEIVRQFCNYFETPLAHILEVFRQCDDLFAPTQPFDRSSIFIESLGMSPAEVTIFTDPDPLGNDKWYELYGLPTVKPAIQNPTNNENATLTITNADARKFKNGIVCSYFDVSENNLSAETKRILAIGIPDSGGAGQAIITFKGEWNTPPDAGDLLVCDASATLKSAKTLSRRLGITYKETAKIVQTGFVNPELEHLFILYKLGVSVHDARFYLDNKGLIQQDPTTLTTEEQKNRLEAEAFAQKLETLVDEFQVTLEQLETELQAIPFDKVLLLADPDAGCNFDLTTLRYANGDPADDISFLRINLFVRLWRKLGWNVEETDRALQAFLPTNAPFDQDNMDKQPFKTALIYLAHLKALDDKIGVGKQSRLKLITLWSDIATTGKKPLYAQLFLTRSVLKNDAVFDDPLGKYLTVAGIVAMAESRKHSVQLENVQPADKIDPALFATVPKVEVQYDALQEVQYLTYEGILSDSDKATLNALSPSPTLSMLLDAVQVKAQEFSLVKGHLLALQGALGLTADEISQIFTDAGASIDTAELSLANVSLLYRYGLFAKALKLSVRELIALKQLSGLDPFKLLHPDPLTTLDEDYPFSQTLRFVKVAEEVKESGLKIEDLEYLLRHRFDETGKYRPNHEGTLVLLKMLAQNVRAIHSEHAVPDDSGTISNEMLRQKLGLALPPDVVERFLSMMSGTVEFTATKTGVLPADKLDPSAFVEEPSIRDISYDGAHQEQKLTFRGVLFDLEKADLMGRLPKPDPPNPHVPSPIFGALLDDVQQQARSFFEKHLQKQAPNVHPTTGFLDAVDFDLLFDQNLPLAAGETEQDRVRNRKAKLANAFLPFLQQRLIRQYIVQALTAHTGADPEMLESLITDERLLANPKSLLESLYSISERGITASFFASTDCTGAALTTVSLTDANTELKDKDGNPFKPAGTNSARFEGYLEVPDSGAYRFYVILGKQNARAEFRFAHLLNPTMTGTATNDGDEVGDGPEEYAELKPGILYRFTLDLHDLNGGDASLLVQGETLPKDKLSQLVLYPLTAMEGAERTILLLTKTLQLLQGLGLSEREARYLLTHAAEFDNLDLNKLPWRDAQQALETIANKKMEADSNLTEEQAMQQARNENPNLATEADQVTSLFKQFLRLAGYSRLKRDLASGTDDLIGIFEANETGDIYNVYPLIARLTRRNESTIKASTKAVFATPAFASEKPLQRLWEVLQVVERFGVPVTSMLEWTRIVNPAVIPEQRFEIARDLKEMIKARFEAEAWQRCAQPIFDKLRQCQRDTLVTYVMHQHGFARMEQLYEYFLIDPGMEPVVQTSRIRLAIGSVQLFIQRCLLNLEKQVHPSGIINAKQWEWMSRYRVWEANRKIFLFPENWLEPEFRDDKSHLFAELEGDLLQGDVSSDLAEDAFLNYLKKLDELARLDIVAMHLEDKPDPAQNTLHVIGRTYSQPHKYFYRRYAHQMWTPWEPVSAEIEGDHLAPVVWRDRLYLFWVTFMEKATPRNGGDITVDPTAPIIPAVKRDIEVQLHWSEYLQGEWSTRESNSSNAPSPIGKTGLSSFDNKAVFIHVSKAYDLETGEERGVYIHLGGAIKQAFYLAGRNSTPELGNYEANGWNPFSANNERANRYVGDEALTVKFVQRVTTEPGVEPKEKIETQKILNQGYEYSLLPCDNNLTALGVTKDAYQNAADPAAVEAAIKSGFSVIASLMKPVFYQDNQHTFFIEPSVTEQTIEEWQEWVTRTPQPDSDWLNPDWWKDIVVIPEIPWKWPVPDPWDPWRVPFDPGSLTEPKLESDWLVNPGTTLLFDDVLIGVGGRLEAEIMSGGDIAGAIARGRTPVNVSPGSDISSGSTVVLTDAASLEQTGLTSTAGGLNVVGSAGLNSALAQNLNELIRSGFGTGMSGAGRLRQ